MDPRLRVLTGGLAAIPNAPRDLVPFSHRVGKKALRIACPVQDDKDITFRLG